MCLSKAKIHRKREGTQTVWERRCSAATVASATAAAVVANGAGFRPAVILVLTNPGRTMSTRTPSSATESPIPCASASSPALAAP